VSKSKCSYIRDIREPLETMLRVAKAVQQIGAAVNTCASQKEKMTITKIVMTVMNLSGH